MQNLKNIHDFYQSSGLYDRVILKNNTLTQNKTIEDLKLEILKFSNFYNKSNDELVFSDGNIKSKIMIIGEAPGVTDEIEGKPFCGETGELLDKMLNAIGLNRDKTYITNVINFRLADNKKPSLEDINRFKPFLIEHIKIANPEYILILGSIALQSLFNNALPISKERGNWKELKVNNKHILCMPSFHPAFLLRQIQQKKLSWEDLKKFRDKINFN